MPPQVISVVTPSYNQGRYLAATIESVLAQEGDFAIDYVIMDGGSTDDSADIIRRYDAKLRDGSWPVKCRGITLRWASERDNGQADAIRKGFAMATGDVVAWLNSDDTYLPGALATAAAYFARSPRAMMIYGKAQFIDELGAPCGNYPTEPFELSRLAVFNFIAQPSTFFRRAALEEVGGITDTLQYVMDYDLWMRLARKFELHYIPEPLATFRLHDESKTMSAAHALANHTEALAIVARHYRWSPLNRVYFVSYWQVKKWVGDALGDHSLPLVLLSLPIAAANYVRMNRGVRLADLRLVTAANLRKMFVRPGELYKEY